MNSGPTIGDAFGALLQAALEVEGRPGQVFEVVERDDGHIRVNDAARYFKSSWGKVDDWAYERVHGRVLDVGCGAGRHVLELQARTVPVVGLDPSPGAIDVCRQRGVQHLIEGTIHDVTFPSPFDTILLLGNNLGLISSREHAPSFLERLAELSAGPGSQILASGIGFEPGTRAADTADGAYIRSNLARGRLPWQVRMRSRFRNLATDWFDYLFLHLPELVDLLENSPWQVTDHIDDGHSYAVRLQLVSRS